jgi:hypothetical protein
MIEMQRLHAILKLYSDVIGYVELRVLSQSLDKLETNLRIVNRQLEELSVLFDDLELNLCQELIQSKLNLQKATLENIFSK